MSIVDDILKYKYIYITMNTISSTGRRSVNVENVSKCVYIDKCICQCEY